jgi:tol-pal system protein YbgF
MLRRPDRRALRLLPALFAGVLTMLTLASPVQAGVFDGDALAAVAVERARLDALTEKADSLTRNQLDFAGQMEALRGDIAKLRGQLEVLTNAIETTQKRQQDFYIDLDNRLRALETAAAPAASAPTDSGATAVANDTAEYEKAVNALKASRYKEAAAGFDRFIGQFPNSGLLASAHYWGAYAHAQQKEILTAAALLGKFAANWPNDERVPEALESQADYLTSAKDLKGARAALELLAAKYPSSDAGKRAKLRLGKK